jgi:hypothetical protein
MQKRPDGSLPLLLSPHGREGQGRQALFCSQSPYPRVGEVL